jgi:cyanophycinase
VCPARVRDGAERGAIVPIGGGVEKAGAAAILRRFAELCGGRHAHIVVIPTASKQSETGRNYVAVFDNLRVGKATSLRIESRRDCEDASNLALIEEATGVYLTGGDQVRLSTTLGGTAVARLLRRRNADGTPVAGTSAGAAFLCEHMIARGADGPTPRDNMVSLAPGLGLTNRVMIDQHFRQRERLGRLLAALSFNPFAIGIGIDEDTAAFIGPDERFQVVGSGAITVVDASNLEYSSMDGPPTGRPVSLIGVRLHILGGGALYDLSTREATPPRGV